MVNLWAYWFPNNVLFHSWASDIKFLKSPGSKSSNVNSVKLISLKFKKILCHKVITRYYKRVLMIHEVRFFVCSVFDSTLSSISSLSTKISVWVNSHKEPNLNPKNITLNQLEFQILLHSAYWNFLMNDFIITLLLGIAEISAYRLKLRTFLYSMEVDISFEYLWF